MNIYSLASLSAIAASSLLAAPTFANSSSTAKYPPEFVRKYSQECLQTSMAEGLEAAEAKKLCSCTLNKFQQQYSFQEFKQLTIASNTDPASQDALVQTGQVCFEELLYE
ncbi:hypothetical protein [Myxosarcina sp. GI1]|uniref:hypothetical protein n=1 Tax=Myxosarcina sp. GI1 TaxID=1541065 RepID=UPI00055A9854|nr:hypothetical protein [Myxosarcina sp. GI1]